MLMHTQLAFTQAMFIGALLSTIMSTTSGTFDHLYREHPQTFIGHFILDNVAGMSISIPEPGSLALLGLAGLGFARRRKTN